MITPFYLESKGAGPPLRLAVLLDGPMVPRYVATILSVVQTCRQQRRDVWEYLTDAWAASQAGRPVPSLLRLP